MTENTLSLIASEINRLAKTHPVGMLQQIRAELKGLRHQSASDIFTQKTTKEKWAFHHGGRQELQYNIGIERLNGIDELRYGVAFSFETSRTLPQIDVLIPKVKLFNDFIQLHSEQYADMRMWHYHREIRSTDYMPSLVPPELIAEGVFIFLGQRQPLDQFDYEPLLDCLDRLLPLYKYIESGSFQPVIPVTSAPFEFHPGFIPKKQVTIASLAEKELDISLRHNDLQEALYEQLTQEFGADNVGTELGRGLGISVDVVVRDQDEFYFYEIKTAQSARACLRQAIGQLLEYAFWPGSQEATRLIVVGEAALDEEARQYLYTLATRLGLRIEYRQVIVPVR